MVGLGFAPVDPPALEPQALSLIRATRTRTDSPNGGRWEDGFSFRPEPNVAGFTSDSCDATVNWRTTTASGVGGNPQGGTTDSPYTALPRWVPPFHVAQDSCSTFGFTVNQYAARARRAIQLALAKRVEYEFWTGAARTKWSYPNKALVDVPAANIINNGGAVSMKRAMSELEQALAGCGAGSRGMIHCRVEAQPQLPVVRREGNLLLTTRDTIVVPGVGYPNMGPGGTEANPNAAGTGQTWLYATGLVNVWSDDADIQTFPNPSDYPDVGSFIRQAMDADTNTVTVYASQPAVAAWDGLCHFAVLATLDT